MPKPFTHQRGLRLQNSPCSLNLILLAQSEPMMRLGLMPARLTSLNTLRSMYWSIFFSRAVRHCARCGERRYSRSFLGVCQFCGSFGSIIISTPLTMAVITLHVNITSSSKSYRQEITLNASVLCAMAVSIASMHWA